MFEKFMEDENITNEDDTDSESDRDEDQELIGKCVICLDRPSAVLYRPCRHLKTCTECSNNIEAAAAAEDVPFKCAVCRADIDESEIIFY